MIVGSQCRRRIGWGNSLFSLLFKMVRSRITDTEHDSWDGPFCPSAGFWNRNSRSGRSFGGVEKGRPAVLDRLFEEARLHVQAGVYASRPWPFETILISILIEHEKALVELKSKLNTLSFSSSPRPVSTPGFFQQLQRIKGRGCK